MFTYAQQKAKIRPLVWPSGEAPNLVASHDQSYIDCLIDLQSFVDCLKQDQTNTYPHCSTLYNCGMTAFDAPRGIIKSLSVIDKVLEQPSGTVTASKVGNLVTASAPFFTAAMVGTKIVFASGESYTILTFIDSAHLWVFDPEIITSPVPANVPATGGYYYISARARINPDGDLELLGVNDGLWHAVQIVGEAGNVQLGPEQEGSS